MRWLAAMAAGCVGYDPKAGETADTGTGALRIVATSVTCDGAVVTLAMTTSEPASDGVVYAQETSSLYDFGSGPIQYSDEHDLIASGLVADVRLVTGEALGAEVRDESTVFRCDAHYLLPGWITYAFVAWAPDGTVADCLAVGGDPAGLVAGDFAGWAVNAPSFDLGGCRVGGATGP